MSLQELPVEVMERIEQHLTYPDRVSLHSALSDGKYDRPPYQKPLFEFWKKLMDRIDSSFNRAKQNYFRVYGPNRRKHRRGRRLRDYDYTLFVQCNGWSLPLIYGANENDEKTFPWRVSAESETGHTHNDQVERSSECSISESEYATKICTVWIRLHYFMNALVDPDVSPDADWPDDTILPAMLRTLNKMNGTIVTAGEQRISMQIRCKTIKITGPYFLHVCIAYKYVPFCIKRYDLKVFQPGFRGSMNRPWDSRWYVRWCCFHENDRFPADLFGPVTRYYEEKIDRIIRDRHPLISDILYRELAMFWRSYAFPAPFTQYPDIYHYTSTWPLPADPLRPKDTNVPFIRCMLVGITDEQFDAQTTAELHANTVARFQCY